MPGEESIQANKTTTPKVTNKTSKKKQVICPVCDEAILDGRKGHESIHCDGLCQSWLHRRCTGLSKHAFAVVSASGYGPFLCAFCRLDTLSKEITSLKATITSLTY